MSLEMTDRASRPRARGGDELILGIKGFAWADLFEPARLKDLLDVFDRTVAAADPELAARWAAYRAAPDSFTDPRVVSDLLVRMGPHLSAFLARLFRVDEGRESAEAATRRHDPVFRFRVDFLRRRVLGGKSTPPAPGEAIPSPAATDALVVAMTASPASGPAPADRELAVSAAVSGLLDLEAALRAGTAPADAVTRLRERAEPAARRAAVVLPGEPERLVAVLLAAFERWTRARLPGEPLAREVSGWTAFHLPGDVDHHHLVETIRPDPALPELREGPLEHRRARDGFGLTDPRMTTREVLGEVHYCIYCHERSKDSCSKGLRERPLQPGQEGALKRNPLGIVLSGCPLDEKISEAHLLRRRGDPLAALCAVMIDNPMCPGTGHRICNDCMKGCIYQAQDPVNIPQIETGILTDVLAMPWGVEIYGLLSRWNPLNVRRPYALPYNGRNVLVVGLGPAGYTLAHHLLNEGFGVVAVDGLKIEPLPESWTGSDGRLPEPIRDVETIRSALDERILAGFGGVAEYGITVRWDKNFLTLLHLTLARRRTLRIYGGVRFGGTLDVEDAWRTGFDHVAIAAGAGRPTLVGMKNNLMRGIRQASDFLMALQLTGAFKKDALANLQVRLPALVIGGGLTAIDSATETAAYYPIQVEKTLDRHEALVAEIGGSAVLERLDPEEREILAEFLEHGRAVRAERARAMAEGRTADFAPLVQAWGGVTLVYRRGLEESPAYRLNHEEVIKGLEEGISIVEAADPVEAIADERGAVKALVFRRTAPEAPPDQAMPDTFTLPARTVLVAAGTTPNITSEKERPGTFGLDEKGKFFQPHRAVRGADGAWTLVSSPPTPDAIFTSHDGGEGRFVSFYGDNHPVYAGSVVRAMASARNGYPLVTELFADALGRLDPADQPRRDERFRAFVERLDAQLIARVAEVRRLTDTIVEVIVHAPLAARKFHPGQFYRLQNYEAEAPVVRGTRLTMEGIALTGAWTDPERGLLSLIVLEMGVSSRLCATLRPGQRVVVMGPTGAPTEIPDGERVLLAGGGLGNAVLFSIARALRESGCRVLYFAGYKKGEDLFKREEIEAATDQVIWSTDSGEPIAPGRPNDTHFRGNIVQAILAYAQGAFGAGLVPLDEVTRIIAIGSDRMMAAVKDARHGVLAPWLRADHVGIGSINSPMQCMMKEVCAQCLQRHVDPVTGKESFVFSCFNQDQKLDWVDFVHLRQRLRANSLQEKLSDLWLTRLLETEALRAV